MSFVTLVRHGQANNGARTEEDYDKLSELGHEQARLAGAYLAQTNHGIREVVTGSLNRQRDTGRAIADALGVGVSEDERLNEINYFALEASMQSYRPFIPGGRDEFILHFPQIMQAWQDGHICCPNETFAEYERRTTLSVRLVLFYALQTSIPHSIYLCSHFLSVGCPGSGTPGNYGNTYDDSVEAVTMRA